MSMRFTAARPYDRGTAGYAPRSTKVHAVEVLFDGSRAERTMCGLEVDGLRGIRSEGHRWQDWLGIASGQCSRCQRAIERRAREGDEMEDLG